MTTAEDAHARSMLIDALHLAYVNFRNDKIAVPPSNTFRSYFGTRQKAKECLAHARRAPAISARRAEEKQWLDEMLRYLEEYINTRTWNASAATSYIAQLLGMNNITRPPRVERTTQFVPRLRPPRTRHSRFVWFVSFLGTSNGAITSAGTYADVIAHCGFELTPASHCNAYIYGHNSWPLRIDQTHARQQAIFEFLRAQSDIHVDNIVQDPGLFGAHTPWPAMNDFIRQHANEHGVLLEDTLRQRFLFMLSDLTSAACKELWVIARKAILEGTQWQLDALAPIKMPTETTIAAGAPISTLPPTMDLSDNLTHFAPKEHSVGLVVYIPGHFSKPELFSVFFRTLLTDTKPMNTTEKLIFENDQHLRVIIEALMYSVRYLAVHARNAAHAMQHLVMDGRIDLGYHLRYAVGQLVFVDAQLDAQNPIILPGAKATDPIVGHLCVLNTRLIYQILATQPLLHSALSFFAKDH